MNKKKKEAKTPKTTPTDREKFLKSCSMCSNELTHIHPFTKKPFCDKHWFGR